MSRMTARETTMPAPADMPCTARKKTSAPMCCDSAQPTEASVKTARPAEHHRAAAEAVGERAVEQIHHREAEQVGRERLLHLDRRGADRPGDAGEGRQVGVDRERPEHAQAGEQDGQGPARAPARACVRRDSCAVQCSRASRDRRARHAKRVKRADRPDSVQAHASCDARARDRHSSGPGIAARLGATYPPARAEPHFQAGAEAPAHAGLFGIAARRDCPFHPTPTPCDAGADSSLLL